MDHPTEDRLPGTPPCTSSCELETSCESPRVGGRRSLRLAAPLSALAVALATVACRTQEGPAAVDAPDEPVRTIEEMLRGYRPVPRGAPSTVALAERDLQEAERDLQELEALFARAYRAANAGDRAAPGDLAGESRAKEVHWQRFLDKVRETSFLRTSRVPVPFSNRSSLRIVVAEEERVWDGFWDRVRSTVEELRQGGPGPTVEDLEFVESTLYGVAVALGGPLSVEEERTWESFWNDANAGRHRPAARTAFPWPEHASLSDAVATARELQKLQALQERVHRAASEAGRGATGDLAEELWARFLDEAAGMPLLREPSLRAVIGRQFDRGGRRPPFAAQEERVWEGFWQEARSASEQRLRAALDSAIESMEERESMWHAVATDLGGPFSDAEERAWLSFWEEHRRLEVLRLRAAVQAVWGDGGDGTDAEGER